MGRLVAEDFRTPGTFDQRCRPDLIDWTATLLAAIFPATDIDTLKAWQAFQIADNAAVYLSKPFTDASFEFHGRALSGQTEQKPRWKRAVHTVGGGDILFAQRSEHQGNRGGNCAREQRGKRLDHGAAARGVARPHSIR